MPDDGLDEIDRLLASVSVIRCVCGNENTNRFIVRKVLWLTYPVMQINPVNRTVYASDSMINGDGDEDRDVTTIWCLNCESEVPLPNGWTVETRPDTVPF